MPLGLIQLERVDPGAVGQLAGRDFGAFALNLQQDCPSSPIFYAGRYASGQILACSTGATGLFAYYRDDSETRSGYYRIVYGFRTFSGTISDWFGTADGSTWTGHCVGGYCQSAGSPGSGTPAPGAFPPDSLTTMTPGERDSTVSTAKVSAVRAGITCVVTGALTGASFLGASWATPALLTAMRLACIGTLIDTAASAFTLRSGSTPQERSPRGLRETALAADRAVVLPRRRPVTGGAIAGHCTPGANLARCRALARTLATYVDGAGEVDSLQLAIVDALNRYDAAQASADTEGQAVQATVLRVYAGALADALTRRHQAGARVVAALRGAGVRARVPAGLVRREMAALSASPPGPVLAVLGAHGVPRQEAVADLAGQLSQADVVRRASTQGLAVLSAPEHTAGFVGAYHSITRLGLAAVVRALAAQGAIPAGRASALEADLSRSPVQRAKARADASRVPGRYGPFLSVALQGLGGG